jgi:NAD+ kinase
MNKPFKRAILYARQHRANPTLNDTLKRLIIFLQNLHIQTFIDSDTANHFMLDLPILSRSEMQNIGDLIIVIGGDGSLLSAARMAITVNVPVIGINRGRLGFLTDISPLILEQQLLAILQGDYKEESRLLLATSLQDEKNTYFQGDALNDVVLGGGNETHLVEFEVYIDNQFVSHYRADGIIIATPTGSTAYALSAGGPIVHPQLQAIILVPKFSHSLNSRPLVVNEQAIIDLKINPYQESNLQLSCDGHESILIKPGQQIRIKKNNQRLRLLHPNDYHYYDTLRIKLGWGTKN